MQNYKLKRYSKYKIEEIPLCDRPREKMFKKGPGSLSTLELLVVLVGTGTKSKDVFSVAKEISRIIEQDFTGVSMEKLMQISGVGPTKACQIIAAIEFSRRYLVNEGILVKTQEDVLNLVGELRQKKQEYFLTLTLDGGHHLIEKRTGIYRHPQQSITHPREIFSDAITDRAAAIIFVHNHPGGEAIPSREDIEVTRRLIDISKLVGIEVLDHIIVNKTDSYSFQKHALM